MLTHVCQLLEAALAHHNLGSYEESLKFLAAARSNLQETAGLQAEETRRRQQQLSRQLSAAPPSGTSPLPSPGNTSSSAAAAVVSSTQAAAAAPAKVMINEATLDPSLGIFLPSTPMNRSKKFFSMQSSMGDELPGVPFDLDMYITACMGNVYQSSGDDEQALVQYSKGWEIAKSYDEADWAAVFLNSIGLVCYYNLRYELGYQCFTSVAAYRAKVT